MPAKKGKKKVRVQDLKPKKDAKGGFEPNIPSHNPPTKNPPSHLGPRPNMGWDI